MSIPNVIMNRIKHLKFTTPLAQIAVKSCTRVPKNRTSNAISFLPKHHTL